MKPLPLDLSRASLKPLDMKPMELLLNLNSGSSPRLMEKVTHQLQSGLPSDSSKKSGSKTLGKENSLTLKDVQAVFLLRDNVLVWNRDSIKGRYKTGDVALGSPTSKGYHYLRFKISDITYVLKRSRVMWMLHYGDWPDKHLDHINGITSDDRIENLRDVSMSQNLRNTKYHRENNDAGVQYNKRYKLPWSVQFSVKNKTEYFGRFSSYDEAVVRALWVRKNILCA